MAYCEISDSRRIYGDLFRTEVTGHHREKSVTIYLIQCLVLKTGSKLTFSI